VKDWTDFIGIVGLILLCFGFLFLVAWMVWEIVQYNGPA
jgi:hypothetical protein